MQIAGGKGEREGAPVVQKLCVKIRHAIDAVYLMSTVQDFLLQEITLLSQSGTKPGERQSHYSEAAC